MSNKNAIDMLKAVIRVLETGDREKSKWDAPVEHILRAMADNYTVGSQQWDHLDAIVCLRAVEDIEHLRHEVNRLKLALHYVAKAMHSMPQHMLAKGITLIDNDRVKVEMMNFEVDTGHLADPFKHDPR